MLTLYHGPAGSGKTKALLSHLVAHHLTKPDAPSFRLIVPQTQVDDYAQKIRSDAVCTFEDFLWNSIKKNTPGRHRATLPFSRNVIQKLLAEKKYPGLLTLDRFEGPVHALTTTLVQLKKNGLDPQKTTSFFSRFMTDELQGFLTLFTDYQKTLEDLHFYDDGDLVLLALSDNFGPPEISHLYIDRLFPLTLGQRELVKKWRSHMNVMVSFSYDHKREEDPYFYPAYSFLGEMADHSQYFEKNYSPPTEICQLADPVHELEFIENRIRDLLKSTPINKIGVVTPNPWYTKRLIEKEWDHGLTPRPLSEIYGLDLDHVFVPAFTQSFYPDLSGDHSFFTPEMLSNPALREILAGPDYQIQLQRLWLDQIIRRSNAIFSYPRIDMEAREQSPSCFLSLVEQPAELVDPIPQKELRSFPGFSKKRSSISEMMTYLRCPRQYYYRHVLKLGDQKKEEWDIPGDVRGRFVHQILNQYFKKHNDGKVKDLQEIVQKLVSEQAKKSFLPFPEVSVLPFLERVVNTVTNIILQNMEWEKEGLKKTRPAHMEWAFGKGDIPPLEIQSGSHTVHISGRIDRVDMDLASRSFSVIDYKTGELESGLAIKKAEALQIPLYLLAVNQILLPDYKPNGGYLIGLKETSRRSGIQIRGGADFLLSTRYEISEEEWENLQTSVKDRVASYVQAIRQGQFDAKPKDADACRVCDYKDICHDANPLSTESGS